LKSKRTLAFWLALIAPAVVVGLQVAMMWDQYNYHLEQSKLFGSAWVFYTQQTLGDLDAVNAAALRDAGKRRWWRSGNIAVSNGGGFSRCRCRVGRSTR
jgi:hypothetical protein